MKRSFVLSRARTANYPGVLHEIVQMIGEEGTAALVAQYGGTRIYISSTLKPEHPLCSLLGHEAAQKISDEFGGLSVEIPRGVGLQRERRNLLIVADSAAGISQRLLALKYHLSERCIRTICNT
jgi:hypothetical protein